MRTFLTLDVVGVVAAVILGALIFFLGGAQGLNFLLVIFLFLVASALVTNFKKHRKMVMRTYERARGWRNVIANGLVPLALAVAYFLNQYYAVLPGTFIVVAYVASVAAITADKFSSELGILDDRVVMLATLKKTKAGVSGGVSLLGILAGAFGALIIGISMVSFAGFPLLLAIVMISGIAGNFVDSFLGYFEDRGFGNKYTSNLVCSAVGALVAVALLMI